MWSLTTLSECLESIQFCSWKSLPGKIENFFLDMTKDKIKQIVLDIIADIAPDEDLTDVKPEVRLRDQLDLDSMDFLDIVMELRKQHGIDVPEAEYRELESLDSSANYLLPKFEASAAA